MSGPGCIINEDEYIYIYIYIPKYNAQTKRAPNHNYLIKTEQINIVIRENKEVKTIITTT